MDARIRRLKLENFKGISAREIVMDGSNVSVYGQNATGKTTLFDAFTWCLFGKDSTDAQDFWVKPHDANGDEIHNLETVVELDLLVDGLPQKFRHSMEEKWVKKNGEADRVYSGNTHNYWVNDVSKSAKEYETAVSEIVSQDVFRLITNPMAFNALKWDKRREFLLKLSPVDVDEIMLAKTEYLPIKAAMEYHKTDIYGVKKVKAESKKRDNEEMAQLPVRISEQRNVLNGLGECDVESARREMAEIDAHVEKIEAAMNSGSEIIDKIKMKGEEVAKVEAELRDYKKSKSSARLEAYQKVSKEIASLKVEIDTSKITLSDVDERNRKTADQIDQLEKQIEETRAEWYAVDEMKPEITVDTVCPACGQDLPEEKIEEAKRKFIEQFELDKEKKLEQISANGRYCKQQIDILKERQRRDQETTERLTTKLAENEPKLAGLEAELKALSGDPDFSSDEKVKALEEALKARKSEYDELLAGQVPVDETLIQKKRDLIARKNELAMAEGRKTQATICETRIRELEKRQKELGIQIADTEQFLMLIDRFVTERCGLLEETINRLFPTVRWSLFERQINGGIKDTCVCLIGGVQFSDANNAAKINAGLEIIGVLSEHYGASVPVFIDNAEAVNCLNTTKAQRISLVVTAEDKELRIEKEEA